MNKSAIFFGRNNCKYSKKLHKILKKKFKIHFFESKNFNDKFNFDKIRSVDYIFCFRSLYILKKSLLRKVKKFAINFHPGTPNYRGIGCLNFALYENSTTYGSTAHIIDEKIDNGKILDIKKFKIQKNDNVKTLLEKTHKAMFDQAINLIKKIQDNNDYLETLLKKEKNIKWSKKIYKRKRLNQMRKITMGISASELKKRIRAFSYNEYKISLKFHNKNFVIHD
ncbi:formyltransferase family protein [Candidatus Pelagibacter sp.]|nr:formyltransferase family protein [Candidatus Pelagibacter sp.]